MKSNILAIIPARIGSKGLPKKNIKLLAGKPLIVHTILAAKKSKFISKVIVSTDDKKIASIAKKYGAEIPFLRPKELAKDTSPTLPVLKHTVRWLEKNQKYKTDIVVCLFPTYPLRGQKEIDAVISKLLKTNAGSVCTVCNAEHHPYWMSKMQGDKTFFFKNRKTKIPERQNLPKLYVLAGGVVAIKKKELMRQKLVFYAKDNRGVVIPSEKCTDIHTLKDLTIAEALMKK